MECGGGEGGRRGEGEEVFVSFLENGRAVSFFQEGLPRTKGRMKEGRVFVPSKKEKEHLFS